jgi:thymidylate kinase
MLRDPLSHLRLPEIQRQRVPVSEEFLIVPPVSSQFLGELFSVLNERYDYAVLRNHEGLPQTLAGRDIDILIDAGQLPALQRDCVLIAARHGYRLVYTQWDTQYRKLVLGKADGERAHMIVLDLMANLNVMGVVFLDRHAVLASRVFNGNVFHLPPLPTLLVKFVYCSALGQDLPARYHGLMESVRQAQSCELDARLSELLGDPDATLEYWRRNKGRRLLVKRWFVSFRRTPKQQLEASLRLAARRVLNFADARGVFVTFSGPDGCGKTTVIEQIMDVLVDPPARLHFRPHLLPNLGEAAVNLKVKKNVDRRYDAPHRAKRRSVPESLVRLAYYMLDYVVGYHARVLPLRWRKYVVVSDRYFTDVIADSERSSIFLNYKFLCALRRIVPRADYNFLIRVAPARILERKQELDAAAIDRIYQRLDYLAARDSTFFWVNNDGPPEHAVRRILQIVFDAQHALLFPKLVGSPATKAGQAGRS